MPDHASRVPAPAPLSLAAGSGARSRRRARRRPLGRAWSEALKGGASIAGGIVLWQLVFDLFIKHSIFVASPAQIVRAFLLLAPSGELWLHLRTSGVEFLNGYLLAVAVGIPVGALMVANARLNNWLTPWIAFIYSTPRVAVAPLLIVWFGIGLWSKALIVFLGAVFPVILNTYTGVTQVPLNYLEVVRSLGGSRPQLFIKVLLPAALPTIMTGLRLAVGRGVIGVVVAEWYGANAGLGYLVYFSAQVFQPAPIYLAIFFLVLFGYGAFALLGFVQRRLAPWHTQRLEAS
ncbi:MAG: ABC transporter permease [Candidatus Tectomicrobia bacterium]|nr:ABC transporter permease [Candidatus Tectomicrobia bacterium]